MSGLQKLFDICVVLIHALALIGEISVPVQSEPLHGSENGVGIFLSGTRSVGIFNAQAELAAEMTGEKPAENGGAATADVQMAGRAGSKSRNNFHDAHPK